MADDTIVITPDHLHVDQVSEIVGAPSAGAISLFVGGPSFLYSLQDLLSLPLITVYFSPLTLMSDQDRIFPYNIDQISDENKEKYQYEDN